MREYQGGVGRKRELEDKGPCGGVQKYMSGEKIDEHRRTSRTVCHSPKHPRLKKINLSIDFWAKSIFD